MLKLRDYQEDSIAALMEATDRGVIRPAVVLPTGAGKTIIFSEFARRLHEAGRRPLIAVHGDQLVKQNASKVRAMTPGASVGIVQGANDETNADIIVSSIDTIKNPERLKRIGRVTDVVIDECHHATANSYMSVLETLGCFDETRAYGFTATMMRSDRGKLGDVWQEVVYERPLRWMIQHGHLVDPHGVTVEVPDLELPQLRGGDYSDNQVAQAITDSSAAQRVVDAWVADPDANHRPTAVFAPNKAVARLFAETFNNSGITAEVVLGETPDDERQGMYKRLRDGKTRILSSCGVLLEGWDEPCVSCAIIARFTQSQGLYIQMVGRVLRLFPGKSDALVMDVVGTAARHSLRCLADLSTSRKRPEQVMEDGESLESASRRWEEDEDWHDPLVVPEDVSLSLRPVDLFADAYSMWLQTEGGTWFTGSPTRYYFLWETSPGQFVIRASVDKFKLGATKLLGKDLTLDFAMAEVEVMVMDDEKGSSFKSGKGAAWRRGNAKPTPAQINYAMKLGIIAMEDGRPVIIDGKPISRKGEPLTKNTIGQAMDVAKVSGMLRKFEGMR